MLVIKMFVDINTSLDFVLLVYKRLYLFTLQKVARGASNKQLRPAINSIYKGTQGCCTMIISHHSENRDMTIACYESNPFLTKKGSRVPISAWDFVIFKYILPLFVKAAPVNEN